MTQPTPHGYPDYDRVAARANVQYISESIVNVAVEQIRGPFFVGHQPAIGLLISGNVNGWVIELEFYNDAGLTQFLEQHTFHVTTAGAILRQSISVLGPWLLLRLTPSAAASDLSVKMWATAAPSTIAGSQLSNLLIGTTGNAIAIGATETIDAGSVWPGTAFLNFQQTAGTAVLTLASLSLGGGTTNFWRRALTAAQPVGEMIALPVTQVRASIQNTSGAATDYSLYLVGQHHIMRS